MLLWVCSLRSFDADVLCLYGAHIHQAIRLRRAKAKMEFNTFKFDSKSSKGFKKEKKNV